MEGTLFYSNHFNTTHVELNFCRPFRVSPRIVLIPHGQTIAPTGDGTRTITLSQGSAFGIGDHPTTRLTLRAMDSLLVDTGSKGSECGIRALDIGTGSGVLAMAAVKLGVEMVVAVDIDPLALHEAKNNIRLNHMDRAIRLTAAPIETLPGGSFDLILANLRPPTLKQLLPRIEHLSTDNCHWVFSGFREEAMDDVIRLMPEEKTNVVGREEACGWAALTIRYVQPLLPQQG